MTDLVCIGELLVDFVPSKVDRNLRDIDMFIRAPGGAPANVAAGFSRLGGKSAFVGKIGNDEFGHFLKETLCSSGVDTSCLIQTDEALTGLAFISLGSDSKHEFIFYGNPSADMLLKPEDVNTNKIMNTRILHFGSVSLSSSPAREATLEAVRFASVNNKVVSFDPNLRLPFGIIWYAQRKK